MFGFFKGAVKMKIKSFFQDVKKLFYTALLILLSAIYHHFKGTENPPWDADLIIISTKTLWKVLSYSKSMPISVVLVLIAIILTIGYWLGRLSSADDEKYDKFQQYLKTWKGYYWKIKCELIGNTWYIVEIEEKPYCPQHKVALRNNYGTYQCDITGCSYAPSIHESEQAFESLQNLARSNQKLMMTEDCEPF